MPSLETADTTETLLDACIEFIHRSQPSIVGNTMVVSGDEWDRFHAAVKQANERGAAFIADQERRMSES